VERALRTKFGTILSRSFQHFHPWALLLLAVVALLGIGALKHEENWCHCDKILYFGTLEIPNSDQVSQVREGRMTSGSSPGMTSQSGTISCLVSPSPCCPLKHHHCLLFHITVRLLCRTKRETTLPRQSPWVFCVENHWLCYIGAVSACSPTCAAAAVPINNVLVFVPVYPQPPLEGCSRSSGCIINSVFAHASCPAHQDGSTLL